MFYDLNVPWSANDPELPKTIAFLSELGYTVIALSVTITGKIPANHTCPIPSNPFPSYPHITFLKRLNLHLSDSSQLHNRASLPSHYDLISITPTTEKLLQQTCQALECDLISLDLSSRQNYPFKHKTLGAAKSRGIKFEICYAGATSVSTDARRNLISGCQGMIRALRGAKTGGVVISSGARRAAECRAPFDVVNLSTVLGLRQEVGRDAIGNSAKEVVRAAEARRRTWRGIVEAVDVGGYVEGAEAREEGKKRKAEDQVVGEGGGEAKLSKKARKKKKSGLMLQQGGGAGES